MVRRTLLLGVALIATLLALAGTAAAAPPVKLSLGPIPVPKVPVEVCVGDRCTTTPPAQSVSAVITAQAAKPGVGVVPPAVLPSKCPGGGVGLAARVTPGSLGANMSGTVTVAVSGADPVTVPIDLKLSPNSPPATISACVGS